MSDHLHELLHLWTEVQKCDDEQLLAHVRRKKLMDRIGKIYDEMAKNGDLNK